MIIDAAPIIEFSPIVIPGKMVELAPIETLSQTLVFKGTNDLLQDLGYLSLQNVTFGPIKTSFPIVMPSHI